MVSWGAVCFHKVISVCGIPFSLILVFGFWFFFFLTIRILLLFDVGVWLIFLNIYMEWSNVRNIPYVSLINNVQTFRVSSDYSETSNIISNASQFGRYLLLFGILFQY